MIFSERPAHRWLYPCRVLRVIDGDTVIVVLSEGFHNYAERRVRLAGLNCPELKAADPKPGETARQFTTDWVASVEQPEGAYQFLLESNVYDAYGRVLATLWRPDGRALNRDLIEAGCAVVVKR